MAQPPSYQRAFSFLGWTQTNPSTPQPGDKLDLEFNAIQITLSATLGNLALIQRDDGKIANGVVTRDSLATDLQIGMETPTPWATATAYTTTSYVSINGKFYVCAVAHTSGTFATDLAAGKWTLVADMNSVLVQGTSRRQEFTISGGVLTLTITGGYLPGYIDVYKNGALLANSAYTATNGTTITIGSASNGDLIKVLAYGGYDIATSSAVLKSGDTMTGDLTMTGTGQIQIPVGTTGQRASVGAVGMQRYNTSIGKYEGYGAASTWRPFMYSDGDTMTGFLTLYGDPVNALHAVTKQYVDAITAGTWIDLDLTSSTDIGTVASANIRATGSGVSISNLGTVASGVTRRVRFTGANTIVYNATSLLTPTAANIVTAADSVATFCSLGSGNWIMTSWAPTVGLPAFQFSGNSKLLGSSSATAAVREVTLGTGLAMSSGGVLSATSGALDVQSFTTPGASTWTKPATGNWALIEVWGAGGGGSKAGTATAGGANGGDYISVMVKVSELGATETITVGDGGAGATTNGAGSAGGTTSVGSKLSMPGGSGGLSGSTSQPAAAATVTFGFSAGSTGIQILRYEKGGFGGTDAGGSAATGPFGTNAVAVSIPGFFAGGGGGSKNFTTAGTSTFGGAGGTAAATAGAGTQPGGGGAASSTTANNGAKGGAGKVRISVF